MAWCDNDDCPHPRTNEFYIGTPVHTFSGYGWYCVFHPECCPQTMDGTDCERDHPASRTTTKGAMRRYARECLFCGGTATVLAPEGASELDVDAEFSSAARSFSDVEEGDPIGVGCYPCSRRQWRAHRPGRSDHKHHRLRRDGRP